MACRLKRQAIIWTNDSIFYWRIYASLDLNKLNFDYSLGLILLVTKNVVEWADSDIKIMTTKIFHNELVSEVHTYKFRAK